MYRQLMQHSPAFAVVVLAAGAGSRFSDVPGGKLLATVGGHPLLARVLDTVREFGPAATIVVLGHGADAIERTLAWRDELRVRNHDPDRGLASSLKVGIDTLRVLPDQLDGAFIVLGDQPALDVGVMRQIARAAADQRPADQRPADRPIVAPRYEQDGPRNPVLLLRAAWPLVDELEGDRGLGPLMSDRPQLVLDVPVPGSMPDVDTPADLEQQQTD